MTHDDPQCTTWRQWPTTDNTHGRHSDMTTMKQHRWPLPQCHNNNNNNNNNNTMTQMASATASQWWRQAMWHNDVWHTTWWWRWAMWHNDVWHTTRWCQCQCRRWHADAQCTTHNAWRWQTTDDTMMDDTTTDNTMMDDTTTDNTTTDDTMMMTMDDNETWPLPVTMTTTTLMWPSPLPHHWCHRCDSTLTHNIYSLYCSFVLNWYKLTNINTEWIKYSKSLEYRQ